MKNRDFVQVYTLDDLQLSGLYLKGDTSKEAIIYIHGFESDFYSLKFINNIFQELSNTDNAIVSIQTRGTGQLTEFVDSKGNGKYIGSYKESLEEAHLDISAWVKFLKEQGYTKIVLMGHSLGTAKCVRYLFEGDFAKDICKLILLAPFDKNAYIERKTKGKWKEHLEVAKKEIESGNEFDTVSDEYEDFPVTYRTYYSWYFISDLGCMFDFYRKDYNFPILNKINIPVKVIVGDKDDFLYMPQYNKDANEIKNIFTKNVKNSQFVIIPNCDHCYVGFEDTVAKEVAAFLP